ncbi:serine kinase [Mesorhizobium sp. M2D.F.Ca.ET.223.01.1.1]|uniref:HPr kinase/phosphorylase n=1 Tax=unclassified Mesorhizobium TaxID=325217 RepID=UPI000FCC5A6B|nr:MULTISPECIES: serine kinase [unclassified Mesorhizobium]TGP91802.1 serine kinase [bacterium M00.F.Ca.ET.221.01.1.1]TGP95411.1 serine kinase [bacterium M00.F.Ca.ET.222.01.1.1]RVD55176.1 serine kinase [Mesorhizobium sp. M2D.F.Ca.ET.140.01.1.1]TGP76490.1 serine kinase [Mesorhizobium sp. M2D.F.Ca.ET.224.01.1.1]TGR90606.1 serine kinase [Mesorhizobium sp. M2D.F.Ca.ET.223.01.1.1]
MNLPIASLARPKPDTETPSARVRHFYKAYGLIVSSEMALPELEPTTPAAPDLEIAVGPVDFPEAAPQGATAFRFEPTRQYLAWQAVGSFMISAASRIDVDPAPGIDDPLLAFPLLGPVMALALHQRGLLVLHASAIAVGGKSVIFMGDKGAGKSTTAGAMIRAGHRLLSDDVVALDLSDPDRPMILPGFPQLKLAADAAGAIRLDQADVRPQVHPQIDKAQHRLRDGFAAEAVPVSRLYMLERGERAAISPMTGTAALPAILKFSYITRFGRQALPDDVAAAHLRQCALIAGQVGVGRLEVPTGLDRIDEAVAAIEADLVSGTR